MDIDSLRDLRPASEAYAALMHEIGHALGLRHLRNVGAGDNWAMQWRALDAITAHSMMAGSWIEAAIGSDNDDVSIGNARDNVLRDGLGNDWKKM